MRIPESWMDRHGNVSLLYERIEPAIFIERDVGGSNLKVFFEEPRDGFTYGCSPTDVLAVLKAVEPNVPSLPDMLALRQPTRKQQQHSRVCPSSDTGTPCTSAVPSPNVAVMDWSARQSFSRTSRRSDGRISCSRASTGGKISDDRH